MKRLVVPLFVASVVSCHIDKLLNGAKTPPSDAPPARVAFSSSLGSARAGDPISPPVQVTVQDSAGHVTVRDTTITLSLGANPGGAKLGGETLARSVNGVATFSGVWLDKAGSGYKLAAAAPALHPDTSAAFSVMPAPPTLLLFTVQPSSAMQDSVIKPPIQVTAYDSLGNKATNFGGSIQLRIGNDGSVSKNAGIAGAVVSAVAGVATFPDVKIDHVGVAYTLTAAFGSAAPVDTSVAFDITPSPPPPPPTGTLNVTTSTTGASPDPNDYTFTVDGGASQAIQTNQTITLNGVTAASHTVQLGDVAGNCTVSNGTSQTVTVPAGGSVTASFSVSCPTPPPPSGDLAVTTSTTGTSQDPDGYAFAVDGGTPQAIGVNQTITLTLPAASHTVVLSGIAANCTVSGGTSRTVTVPAGGSVTASFAVSCSTPTGTLNVTTSTTGASPDPNGYTFTVDGGASQAIQTNQTITLNGVTAASHTVQLGDVAGNCTVSNGTSQTVTVPAGGSVTASFSVSCPTPPPPSGDLAVTTSTTGTSQDPDGYAFAVDGGTPQSIGINQTITLTGVAAGTHTVVLSGVAANCSVSGGTSQTVTVPAGGTVTAAFSVSCTALPGSLTVSTSTSGGSPDPNGYTFTVDGGSSQAIGNNATVTLTGVTAGNHTVTLSGLAANCTVSGGPSQTVNVPAGGTGTASFSVSCPTPNQPPSVTAGPDETVLVGALYTLGGASFSDPDHTGPWTVTIAWGDGTSDTRTATSEGSISGQHSYPVTLLTHDYQLTVTVRDAAGATTSASKTVRVLVL